MVEDNLSVDRLIIRSEGCVSSLDWQRFLEFTIFYIENSRNLATQTNKHSA